MALVFEWGKKEILCHFNLYVGFMCKGTVVPLFLVLTGYSNTLFHL